MQKTRLFLAGMAILALATIGLIAEAWARCPPGTSYQCHQGFNGKVVCGCR